MGEEEEEFLVKQINCWIPISEADIPPILHKGFKEDVIIRKVINPIINKKSECMEEKKDYTFINHEYDMSVDDETVLLVPPQDDGEAPTMFLNNNLTVDVYLKRMKTGEIVQIDKEHFVIGKSSSADYVVTGNPTISRHHAVIIKTDDGYYLKDLKSSNHTYVGEEEIIQPVKLINGTEIRLAKEIFVFSMMIEK